MKYNNPILNTLNVKTDVYFIRAAIVCNINIQYTIALTLNATVPCTCSETTKIEATLNKLLKI